MRRVGIRVVGCGRGEWGGGRGGRGGEVGEEGRGRGGEGRRGEVKVRVREGGK